MDSIKDGKIKSQTNDNKKLLLWCGIAFLVTAAGCLIANYVKGHFPFGDYSVLFSDLATEYSIYLNELWDKVHSGGSILYSWRTAMGGVFLGNIMYYVSSPLNIFALIFKKSSIDEILAVLVWVRQALAAGTMCFFLSKKRGGSISYASAVCGILYAFCGWSIGYYYCTIWLDVFVLLPLMLLGIERIIDKKSIVLYSTVLGIMLFSNFYMTFFACVFAVIYWLWYYFSNYSFRDYEINGDEKKQIPFIKSRFFGTGSLFAGASVLSVLILGVIIVPLVLQMSRNTANLDAVSKASYFTNITEQFSALFSGADFNTHLFRSYPAAYTGVLTLVILPLFFLAKKITKKEKIAAGIVAGFMLVSFNVPFLDYLWHGLRFPTNYPFRQAYLFSVIAVILVYNAITNIKSVAPKGFIACGVTFAAIIGVSVVEKTVRAADGVISIPDIIITCVLFIAFFGVIMLIRFGRKDQLIPGIVFMLILCIIDGTYTYASNIRSLDWTQSAFDNGAEVMENIVEKAEKNEDELFYRTEIQNHWMINDGALFGYNGIRQSSSMTSSDTFGFLRSLGMDSNRSNFVEFYQPTPVFMSFMGIKHIVEREDFADYLSYSYLASSNESFRIAESGNGYSIYKLGNALSLGFAAKKELAGWVAGDNAVDNQISLYGTAAGTDKPVLVYCDKDAEYDIAEDKNMSVEKTGDNTYRIRKTGEIKNSDGSDGLAGMKYTVKAEYSGLMYLYVTGDSEDYITYIVEMDNPKNGAATSFYSYSTSFCSGVYGAAAGETIDFYIYPTGTDDTEVYVRAFQVDPTAFNDAYNAISEGGELKLTEFSDTHFKGSINVADDDRILCVTVPYDPGWTVTLDGEKLSKNDIVKIGGALYGIPVAKGTHTVEFNFRLYGLGAGIAVSIFGILVCAGYVIFKKKKAQ